MQITPSFPAPADSSANSAGATAPAAAATPAGGDAASAAPAAPGASIVSLSPQALQLAASASQTGPLALPDLDGIAQIDQALAGVPDTSATQARTQAQLAREKDKLKSKFSMLDVDAFLHVREKIRAKVEARPETPAAKQQAEEDAAKQRIKDSQPL